MIITSTAFQQNTVIPSKYTCDGNNTNPPLSFSQVPKETESLVLLVDDPDAPQKTWVHWVLYNIPPATLGILQHSVPPNSMFGTNDFGTHTYGGPCPPSGTHRYFFKLYALDSMLNLPEGATKDEVEEAMQDHIIASAELIGLYKRG